MKSPATLLLLPLALITLAGCSDPVDESAWSTYKVFAGNVHSGNFQAAREMLEHKAPAGWTPRIGGPATPTRHFSFKSVQLDGKSCVVSGDTARIKTDVTVSYADRRKGPEVVFMYVFGGGEWFAQDEKLHYTHSATLRRVNGVWKVSDVQIQPKR